MILRWVEGRLPFPMCPTHWAPMTYQSISRIFRFGVLGLLAEIVLCLPLVAQGPVPDAPAPAAPPATALFIAATRSATQHSFWDKKNSALFFASAAMNGADFAVTRANLQNGGEELNPVVRLFGRGTRGLAMNFAGETAGIISLSYFFHKTGHHKLERAAPLVNLGASAGAVTYGLLHR
jgi:hypothetical protein